MIHDEFFVVPESKNISAAKTLMPAFFFTPGRSVIIGCGRLPSPAVFSPPGDSRGSRKHAGLYGFSSLNHNNLVIIQIIRCPYVSRLSFPIILWIFQADRLNSLQMRKKKHWTAAKLRPFQGGFLARVIRVYGDDEYSWVIANKDLL